MSFISSTSQESSQTTMMSPVMVTSQIRTTGVRPQEQIIRYCDISKNF